jgi:hypothetical protein
VRIWPWGQVPASGGTAPSYTATTDSSGRAVVPVAEGNWSVLVSKEGKTFWTEADEDDSVQDTLRTASRLSGIVRGGSGDLVSLVGLGTAISCDSGGYFQLDSLPKGDLTLSVSESDTVEQTLVDMDSGASTMVLAVSHSIPRKLADLSIDTLLPLSTASLPASAPLFLAVGDTGAFSIALRLWRSDTNKTASVLAWGLDQDVGVALSWKGPRTLSLVVDGVETLVSGVQLGTGKQTVGLAWTGSELDVYLNGTMVASSTSTSLSFRAGWSDPTLGEQGISEIDWLATSRQSGSTWFSTITGL